MAGINRDAGGALDGWQHVRQSIIDILTTPIGTRVMRRDYGARLLDLLDKPQNYAIVAEATLLIAQALSRWEPRFMLSKVDIVGASPGQLVIDIAGIYIPDGHLRKVTVTVRPTFQ
jgi:hypothetical protein